MKRQPCRCGPTLPVPDRLCTLLLGDAFPYRDCHVLAPFRFGRSGAGIPAYSSLGSVEETSGATGMLRSFAMISASVAARIWLIDA